MNSRDIPLDSAAKYANLQHLLQTFEDIDFTRLKEALNFDTEIADKSTVSIIETLKCLKDFSYVTRVYGVGGVFYFEEGKEYRVIKEEGGYLKIAAPFESDNGVFSTQMYIPHTLPGRAEAQPQFHLFEYIQRRIDE